MARSQSWPIAVNDRFPRWPNTVMSHSSLPISVYEWIFSRAARFTTGPTSVESSTGRTEVGTRPLPARVPVRTAVA